MINRHLNQLYQQALDKNIINKKYQPYYIQWLEKYLQFCDKFQLPCISKTSLDPFLKSLQTQDRQEFQINQARHAVFLYYMVYDENPGITHPDMTILSTQQENKPDVTFTASWDCVFDRFKTEIELRHYSARTFEAYGFYIHKFAEFVKFSDPDKLTSFDAKRFLALMASTWRSSASSQNLAFNAFLFLFKFILLKSFDNLADTPRAKTKKPVPDILSREEIAAILRHMQPPYSLIAKLAYGCGLRLSEVMSLRTRDFNLDNKMLTVTFGKGGKSRYIPLPEVAMNEINRQFFYVRNLHKEDIDNGFDGVFLPIEVERKSPGAALELAWQWFFPAQTLTAIKETRENRRYHIHETSFQKMLKIAAGKTKITRNVNPHILRHSFASHLVFDGYDIRQIQELLGHSDIRTTMIYMHTVKTTPKQIKSPLDV